MSSARSPTATGRWRRGCSRSARTSTSAIRACWRSRRCCDVKKKVKPYLDLQLVAFPQDGVLRSPGALELLKTALDAGRRRGRRHPAFRAHHGATAPRACASCARSRRSAACWSTCIATRPTTRCRATSRRLACETQRLGLQGRVTGSHLTSMHSMDNYYVSQADPADGGGAAERDRQSADQHHDPGPARHVSRSAAA